MKAVAFADPRLQRESTVDEFEDEIRTPKRIANGLPLDERLVALARKAGAKGVTKTDLLNAIHPRVAAADMEKALQRLGSEGRLQSVRASGRGRPAVRWSVKEEGPPHAHR